MNIDKDHIIEFTKTYVGEIVAIFCGVILLYLALFLKKQLIIIVLGIISIGAIALEKRAKGFDKIVAVLVIFSLAIGFMLFN